MAKQSILIVEDDKNISKLVKYNLEQEGYECSQAYNGEKALEALKNETFDIIILDIMLPGMSGLDVAKAAKADESLKYIPIIMLTARGEEIDRIVGLELGADDYMVKPISPRELALRIKAILQRNRPREDKNGIIKYGDITIDTSRHKILVKNKPVEFTQMEFKLLVTFIERAGRVQTREQLLEDVWNIDSTIDTRTIDTHIKRIREKLGKTGACIETVRGLGYRLKDEDED
jgi:DNA-binding response OmpR family regulator